MEELFSPHILVAPILFLALAITVIIFGWLCIISRQALERENGRLRKEILDYEHNLDIVIRGRQQINGKTSFKKRAK